MSKLRAFVGHSFTKEDDSVVRAILEYLKQIQEMDIGFSWEHAKPAEPKILAEKVMALIEDKNLFIGICTKKERVIEDKKLKQRFFCRDEKCAKNEDFGWKTSDWIIQEIGLAFGREMDVILLVEEGLRSPGGFQGDLEYIQFCRNSPEKSFIKILEMIRALLPKAKQIEASVAEKPKSSEEETPKEEGDNWLKPKPEWNWHNYEFALIHMVISEDKEGEEKIYNAYLETDEGKKKENINSWLAVKEYAHIWLAKDGSLEKLEKIAKENSENSIVQKYLARGYRQYEEENKAAVYFLKAAENETDKTKKLKLLGEVVTSYAKAKNHKNLEKFVIKIKELSKSMDKGELPLLFILRDVAEIQEDKVNYLSYLERILDIKPDDNDSRFKLAYAHSNENHKELALYHYLKIPFHNRGAMEWNNLGVACGQLNLDGKSIDAYRYSEEKNETLAMDNIARKFLNSGFFNEVQEQCDKARKEKDYNKNIDDTSFKLKGKREEEDKKQKEILDNIKPVHDFYVNYGRAAAKENISEFNEKWIAKQCPLSLKIKNNKLTAYGTYEVESLGNLFASKTLSTPAEKTQYEIFYEGSVTGFTVKGTIRISKAGKVTKQIGLLNSDEDTKEVLMVFSDDLSSIKVYQESTTYDSQRFHELTKDKAE